MIPCHCGDLKEGERVLEPLYKFGSPVVDAIQPMPFPAMQSMMAAAFPDGNEAQWTDPAETEHREWARTGEQAWGHIRRTRIFRWRWMWNRTQ